MTMLKYQCPVCKSTDIRTLKAYRGNHPAFSDLSLCACNQCGMVFANPMPDKFLLKVFEDALRIGANSISPWCIKESNYYKFFKRFGSINRGNILPMWF